MISAKQQLTSKKEMLKKQIVWVGLANVFRRVVL